MQGLWTVTAPSIASWSPGPGLDPQQQRLAGLEHAQGVEAYARLSAMAADEALDAAVRVDQRRGADLDARRPRGAHHDGLDVGDALGREGRGAVRKPLGDHADHPPVLRCDCNPVSFPPVGTDPVARLSDTARSPMQPFTSSGN